MTKLALSIDLEPNPDGTISDVPEIMRWYDNLVQGSTIYTTYKIATEIPQIVAELSRSHEIGMHVHPKEFGYEHDDFTKLSYENKRKIISTTMEELLSIRGVDSVDSFRAGRHCIDDDTLNLIREEGFSVDASYNINYGGAKNIDSKHPVLLSNNLVELPVSYYEPRWLSKQGLNKILRKNRFITATASTLRSDTRISNGVELLKPLFTDSEIDIVSMYLHPYDLSDNSTNIKNSGAECRARLKHIIKESDSIVSAYEIYKKVVNNEKKN